MKMYGGNFTHTVKIDFGSHNLCSIYTTTDLEESHFILSMGTSDFAWKQGINGPEFIF